MECNLFSMSESINIKELYFEGKKRNEWTHFNRYSYVRCS